MIPTIDSTNPTPTMLVLADGSSVSKDFYESIKQHVLRQIPSIPLNTSKSLKHICKSDFWALLSNGDRRTAGICVANMVTNHELPLICMPHRHEYPKKYSRI